MKQRLPISDQDVVEVVRLLGQVAGMSEPVVDRRRALIRGLAEMIEADVWIWVCTRAITSEGASPFFVLDGGWVDEVERTQVWHANAQPEMTASIATGLDLSRPQTFVYDQTHSGWGDGGIYERMIAPTGLRQLLFSVYPIGPTTISGIGLHRRIGRSPYSDRDRALVHLVVGQIDWLHRADTDVAANSDKLERLTPREREVMLHLLGPGDRKSIAGLLAMSEHTLGDHCKQVFNTLEVHSRAQLQAMFMPGGKPRTSATVQKRRAS